MASLRQQPASGTGSKRINRVLYCQKCDVSHAMPPVGDIESAHAVCPACGFEQIKIITDQKQYTCCPQWCRNEAQSTIDIAPCAKIGCDGKVHVKRTQAGAMAGLMAYA